MEDLHFFHDSMANASKKQDEDSKSITSMQEFFATNRLTEVVLSRLVLSNLRKIRSF